MQSSGPLSRPKISRSRSQSNSYPPRASATNSFVVLKAPSFLLIWLLFARAVPSFAPGQGPDLQKNASGALPLRRWTARKRQRRKAMLSFLSRKDILDSDLPACHQVVADKVLYISVLCYLSARFCSRKNQEIIHRQTHSRHDLCVRCFCQQWGGKSRAAGKWGLVCLRRSGKSCAAGKKGRLCLRRGRNYGWRSQRSAKSR